MQSENNSNPSKPVPPSKPSGQNLNLVGQEIGGCIILEKVAEGGMGTVFKAKHKALDRIVCVKVLSPALANDKKAVGLFLTEARAIAEIDHPNIVFVYNVGKERGYHYIVMSFIEGESLSSIVRRRPNLPLSFIINSFCGILQGLEAAHQKGIIHRDIKPSNILINKKLEPKIVDFGIAKKVDKDKGVAKTTELAGTAYFISPEQALGKPIDARTDLYALGASLFYVLTGKYPFTGKNSMDIIQKHINMPVPDILTYRSNIPSWLVTAVNKLMAKKPEDRFQSAAEALLFFKKSREDEKLLLNKGLNISEEVGLQLSTIDDKKPQVSTDRSRKPPVRRYSSDINPITKVDTPQTFMPVLDGAKADGAKKDNKNVKKNTLTTPSKIYKQTLKSFIKMSSVSVAFVGIMLITAAAIFFKLGAAVAAFNAQNAQLSNVTSLLTEALFSPQFFSQNIMLISAAIIFIIVLCVMAFVKLLKTSVPIMFIIAIFSYVVGALDLAQSTSVISFTSTASLLIYSFFCASLAIKINEKVSLPLIFKIVSIVLFIAGFIFVYNFAEPAQSTTGPLTVKIFYVLFALCTASCVGLLFNASSFMRFLTPCLFVSALIAVFFYQTSGNYYYLKDHYENKAFLTQAQKKLSNPQTEEEIQELMSFLGNDTPASEKDGEKMYELIINFEEEPDMVLSKIYNAQNLEPQMIDKILWRYSIRQPFNALQDYRKNGEFMLIIVWLILYGLIAYIIDVLVYKEEKWTLI